MTFTSLVTKMANSLFHLNFVATSAASFVKFVRNASRVNHRSATMNAFTRAIPIISRLVKRRCVLYIQTHAILSPIQNYWKRDLLNGLCRRFGSWVVQDLPDHFIMLTSPNNSKTR